MDVIPPEALLAAYPEPMRAIGEALRALVRRVMPEALERVRPGWRLIGYDLPAGRRSVYCCFIAPEPEHVHLGFEYGTAMADPDRLLLGEGVTRQVRWLTFRDRAELDAVGVDRIERLVDEAARVALLPRFARLGGGRAAR